MPWRLDSIVVRDAVALHSIRVERVAEPWIRRDVYLPTCDRGQRLDQVVGEGVLPVITGLAIGGPLRGCFRAVFHGFWDVKPLRELPRIG